MKKTILLCGHTSFAAQGLVDVLRDAGHEVICYSRGSTCIEGDVVHGPIVDIERNPHLQRPFDIIINYILLKNESITENIEFMRSIVRLCKQTKTSHLIQISSVSVYRSSVKRVTEDSEVEVNPQKVGSYAALKLAVENDLVDFVSKEINLSLIRPGFILGKGLSDPLIAAGVRTPLNTLLVLGNGNTQMPLISRDDLNQGISEIVSSPPLGTERLLMVSRHSPTKKSYLKACNRILGLGHRTDSLPIFAWKFSGLAGEIVSRAIGKGDKRVFAKILALCVNQTFDPSRTEKRIGFLFAADWESQLKSSFEH